MKWVRVRLDLDNYNKYLNYLKQDNKYSEYIWLKDKFFIF